jgi:transposase
LRDDNSLGRKECVVVARSKRSFSVEFREKAVAYVVEQDKSIAGAARELGIGESTLANWIKTAREQGSGEGSPSASEREEIRELRAENRELQMRVELLKKAAAYFASETQN